MKPEPSWEGGCGELPAELQRLLEEHGADKLLLESMDAVDEPKQDRIRIDYVFTLLDREPRTLILRAHAPRGEPECPSIAGLVPAAAVYEMEIYDLLGVRFRGNPWLREGFLKPIEMEGTYPLRKG